MIANRSKWNMDAVAALPPGSRERAEQIRNLTASGRTQASGEKKETATGLGARPNQGLRSKVPGMPALAFAVALALFGSAGSARAEEASADSANARRAAEVETLRGLLALQYPMIFARAAAESAAASPMLAEQERIVRVEASARSESY